MPLRSTYPLSIRILVCKRVTLVDVPPGSSEAFPFWRFYWADRKAGTIIHDETAFELGPESIIAVPPGVGVARHITERLMFLNIHAVVRPPFHNVGSKPVAIPVTQEQRERVDAIIAAARERKQVLRPRPSLLVHGIVQQALELVPESEWRTVAVDPRLIHVLEFMEENAATGLANEQLAEMAHMSLSSFAHRFRKEVGVPPQDYIRSLRLEQATRSLLETDRSIDKIAEDCGFCNRNYLTRSFHKVHGMGPAAFRRQFGVAI